MDSFIEKILSFNCNKYEVTAAMCKYARILLEKDLIYLKYNEDLSIKEIAEILHLSEENVKVKLFRTKEKLFNSLKERCL